MRPSGSPPTKTAESAFDSDLERLLLRCRRGDADAWATLVARLQNLVYSIARRYGLNEDDSGDVFMTAFQALHRNLDRIESGRALPKWLATTAARESLRLKRLRSRTDNDAPLEEILASDDRDAEAEAVRADSAERVRLALDAMPGRCRDLLHALYDATEAAYTEISGRLGIPIGAIGPTRARCLEKLRKSLEKDGFFG